MFTLKNLAHKGLIHGTVIKHSVLYDFGNYYDNNWQVSVQIRYILLM